MSLKKMLFIILSITLIVGLVQLYSSTKARKNAVFGHVMSESDFRDKLAQYRMERDKLTRAIQQLEDGRVKAIEFLKENQITNVADAKGNFEAEIAIKNLKSATESIADLNLQFSSYDNAISRISGMLDQLERDRIYGEAKLSQDQEIELRAIVIDLNEQLEIGKDDPLLDAELDKLIQSSLDDNR